MQGALPLNALRAFEAAARHLSFTRAAAELHVTQAAVSHQVKTLEQRLGVKLFRRLPKSLLLTDEGQTLLPELRDAFARIGQALSRVGRQEGGATLSVTSLTTFALTWLVPRLPRFQAAHPEIEVRLATTQRLVDFAREDVDVALRYGDGAWRGLTALHLFDDELTPLCGRAHKDRLKRPEDLRDVPLIDASVTEPPGVGDWQTWLRAAGLADTGLTPVALFDSTKIAVQASIDGLGVAIGPPGLFAEDLAAGRLFQPFPLTVRNGKSYWLAYPEGSGERRKVRAFRDWVLAEIRAAGLGGSDGFVPPASRRQLSPPSARKGRRDAGGTGTNRTAGVSPASLPPVSGEPSSIVIRSRGYLPHLEAAEATYFVTFRLAGTLPRTALRQAQEERSRLAPSAPGRSDSEQLYAERVDALLHDDHDHRFLADARVARIVVDALRHFDGTRYRLRAWCIMPNHVHVVLTIVPARTPAVGGDLADIVQSWKSSTAHAANRILGRTGAFWHREYYDHLVRDDGDFARCLEYTIENPVKAGLCERWEEWPWSGLQLEPAP